MFIKEEKLFGAVCFFLCMGAVGCAQASDMEEVKQGDMKIVREMREVVRQNLSPSTRAQLGLRPNNQSGLLEQKKDSEHCLSFSREELGEEGMKGFVKGVLDTDKEALKGVTALNFRSIGMTEEGARHLAYIVKSFESLKTLDVRDNPIGLYGLKGIVESVSKLGCFSSLLVTLDLVSVGSLEQWLKKEGLPFLAREHEKEGAWELVKLGSSQEKGIF